MTDPDQDIESVRTWLRKQGGSINHTKVTERIRNAAKLQSTFKALRCLEELRGLGEIECEWGAGVGPLGRITICVRLPNIEPGQAAWMALVDEHSGIGAGERQAFHRFWPKIVDWPSSMYGALIDEVLAARKLSGDIAPYMRSASGKLASSKLLSLLPQDAIRDLGVNGEARSPICFLVAGPPDPEAVVLVENANAFERAIHATADLPVCWISVYGFGAGALDTGDRLAEGVARPGAAISATRMGSPPPLADLLAVADIYHWGDLDYAGLRIFQRIASFIPRLQLSAIYEPMINLLEAGGGHPYVSAVGKEGQRTNGAAGGDSKLARLFDLCRTMAVDQEHVSAEAIHRLAMSPLHELLFHESA